MLFFDLDGTLLDSNGIWLEIDIEFLGRHGISPVPEDYTWYVTHHSAPDSARYTRERFQLSETAEEIQEAWLDMAREAYARQLELKPGVRSFLARCRGRDIPMAVLTSCIPELCRAALERHGIFDWFQGVIYAQTMGLGKGESRLYRLAAQQWGEEPEACILFEDSPGYCAAAQEAGFYVAGVQDALYAGQEEALRARCQAWVEDFRAVPEELERRIFSGSGAEPGAGPERPLA